MEGRNAIVGVMADLRRRDEGDFHAEQCSVFGINEEEHVAIGAVATIKPKEFVLHCRRYLVETNPWTVMRILANNFGFYLPVTPIGGKVHAGDEHHVERRTQIWTLQKTYAVPMPVLMREDSKLLS